MFHLRDEIANKQFGSRVKDVFANLGTGLVKHDEDAKDSKNDDKNEYKHECVKYSNNNTTSPDLPSEGKSVDSNSTEEASISVEKKPEYEPFKRPNPYKSSAQLKCRGKFVPGHRRHPEKWTKYSLANVSPDQMSDRSNTKAALQFLSQLRDKKKVQVEEPADLNQRVVFKKRERREEKEIGEDGESGEEKKFCGAVRVMPQFEVGRKKSKVSKCTAKRKTNDVSLKLSHLDEDGED